MAGRAGLEPAYSVLETDVLAAGRSTRIPSGDSVFKERRFGPGWLTGVAPANHWFTASRSPHRASATPHRTELHGAASRNQTALPSLQGTADLRSHGTNWSRWRDSNPLCFHTKEAPALRQRPETGAAPGNQTQQDVVTSDICAQRVRLMAHSTGIEPVFSRRQRGILPLNDECTKMVAGTGIEPVWIRL